jgi:hypothetical protein
MAYSTANPPALMTPSVIGAPAGRLWMYRSTDAATAVRVNGYFTNGYNLGMRAGDIVYSVKTDASPISVQMHIVSVATAATTDLSDGLAITATNTD